MSPETKPSHSYQRTPTALSTNVTSFFPPTAKIKKEKKKNLTHLYLANWNKINKWKQCVLQLCQTTNRSNVLFFPLSPLTSAWDSFHVRVKVTASTLHWVVFKAWGGKCFSVFIFGWLVWAKAAETLQKPQRCHCSNMQGEKKQSLQSDATSLKHNVNVRNRRVFVPDWEPNQTFPLQLQFQMTLLNVSDYTPKHLLGFSFSNVRICCFFEKKNIYWWLSVGQNNRDHDKLDKLVLDILDIILTEQLIKKKKKKNFD